MDAKKWIPWNWFKKEEENDGKTVPAQRGTAKGDDLMLSNPMDRFHREIDRLFEQAFRSFGMRPFGFDRPAMSGMADGWLKPTLDLAATENEYTISVEVPGVDEKDVNVELVSDTLTIRGEKKQENEKKDKNYYRKERSYGIFQRTLSLPEDADQDAVKATFNKGILTIKVPRKELPKRDVRQISVQSL